MAWYRKRPRGLVCLIEFEKLGYSMSNLINVDLCRRAEGSVATVTIVNAAKRNALPAEGRLELASAVRKLSLDPDLRVIVLTGEGEKAFIGGANIGQMSQFQSHEIAQAGSHNTHLACDAMRRAPVPVIARINGYCLGTGMEIAAACDLRVGTTNSQYGMPEVNYGLPSGMEACLLPRLVGWGKAMELVYTAQMMNAQEAHRVGFLQRLVPYEELDAAVAHWVAAILGAGPRAIRLQKELNRDWERMGIADAVQQGIRAVGMAHQTDEPKRMMTAYLEKRAALKAARASSASNAEA
jgi:enoyl-CoA hydratase